MVSRIPYHYAKWSEIPEEHKSTMWLELETYFDVGDYLHHEPPTDVEVGITISCAKLYKGQKHRFGKTWFDERGGMRKLEELKVTPPPNMPSTEWEKFIKFRTSDAFQSRSLANKGCRSKQNIIVRHGRNNMAQIRFKNRASPIAEYRRLRTLKGVFTEREAEEFYNKMVDMRKDPQHASLTDFDIVTEVLGDRRGWSRGIGQKLPKSGYISSSSSPTTKKTYTQAQVDEMLAKVRAEVSSEIGPIYQALCNAGIQIPPRVNKEVDQAEDGEEEQEQGEDMDEEEEDQHSGDEDDDEF